MINNYKHAIIVTMQLVENYETTINTGRWNTVDIISS